MQRVRRAAVHAVTVLRAAHLHTSTAMAKHGGVPNRVIIIFMCPPTVDTHRGHYKLGSRSMRFLFLRFPHPVNGCLVLKLVQ